VACGSTTTGYFFRLDYRDGFYPLIANASNITSGSTWTILAEGTTNSAAITGWQTFAIYMQPSGYMSLWINGNLACSVVDITYPIATTGNVVYYGYEVSTGKISQSPVGTSGGTSSLNQTGNLVAAISSSNPFTYSSSTTTMTWTWSAFTIYFADGSSINVSANGTTASAGTPSSGTTYNTSNNGIEFTGLTSDTTYYWTWFYNLVTGTIEVLFTGTSAPSYAQEMTTCLSDNSVPLIASGLYITAATTTSGTGGGHGGGGNPCFSPDTKVRTHRGDIPFSYIKVGDFVLTAKGTWRPVRFIKWSHWQGEAYDMGDGIVTPNHLLLKDGAWVPARDTGWYVPTEYDGRVGNLWIDAPEGDESSPETEHSYTLASGVVAHNTPPIC
jgi:hypothetical protein